MSLFGGGNKPGGLSINTGAANLFSNSTAPTNSSQAPAASSLFGGAAAATAKPNLLLSSTSTTSTPSAGTLFGAGAGAATSAPSGGLFGNAPSTTQPPSQAGTLFGGMAASKPAGGSLFGGGAATTTATTQAAGSGLFGAAPAAQPATGGGLFGANTTTQQPATGGGLFGSSTTTQQPATGGGLFGNSTAAQPAAAAGGGLFGAAKPAATSTSLFGGNAGGGGGLFGNSTAQANTQSTGLFGQSAQPAQSTSLFGQPAAAAAPNAGASLFGNAANQSTSNRPGLNEPQQYAPQQTQRSIFTSSIGQYTAAQTTVPGVRVDASNLRPTTRFGDLHEVLQQELERLDDLILRQQKHADECTQAMPAVAHALSYVPADAAYCERKLDTMQAALEADAGEIDDLKSKTRACADDAKIGFRNVSALRTPSQFSIGPGAGPVPAGLLDSDSTAASGQDLHAYVGRQVNEMNNKLDRFKRGLSEVESYMRGVEMNTYASLEAARLRGGADGAGRSADDQIRELANVLREFEGGILGVAGKVGGLREKTQEAMLEETRQRGRLSGLY